MASTATSPFPNFVPTDNTDQSLSNSWPTLSNGNHTDADEQHTDSDPEQPDYEPPSLGSQLSNDELDGVIGISIGPEQSHLKSIQTPAAEKTQALEDSGPFPDVEPEDTADEDVYQKVTESPTSDRVERDSNREGQVATVPTPTLPKSNAGQIPTRSDASRSVLREGLNIKKRRSWSGTIAVADSLRAAAGKLMNYDMPSISLPKSANFTSFGFGGAKPKELEPGSQGSSTGITHPSTNWYSSQPSPLSASTSTPKPAHRRATTNLGPQSPRSSQNFGGFDGNFSSIYTRSSDRPQTLWRVTSDSSLYLRRELSRTSTLEDTGRWENVQDQVNSRFKAIRDSFQDSNLRLPKMSDLSSLMPSMNRLDGDQSSHNAQVISRAALARLSTGLEEQKVGTPQRPILNGSNPTEPAGDSKSNHPILSDALSQLTGDVLVLGGYRGSVLRSAKPPNRQVWIPVKVGLNLRKVDLEVGLTRQDEERMQETIFPSGVLSHIGPVDICRRLLKKLHKSPNTKSGALRVHDYGYDWRLSPDLLVKQLIGFLETLECNHAETPKKYRGATIISHSLGGLLIRSAINQRPDLFAGVVYAGVPQHCVNILGPLRNGDDVLLSSRVLTAQVNFTLRTSFALMPESGYCFFNGATKERYDVDFFDPKTWEHYRLTPCLRAPLPPYQSVDLRKGIIGSVSDTITSLPKRATNIMPRDPSPMRHSRSPARALQEAVDQVTLEPSMKSGHPHSPDSYHHQGNTSNSIATKVTISHHEAFSYLSRTLAIVLEFKRSCYFNASNQTSNLYPPASVLYNKDVPTVYGARVASREAIKHSDAYDDLAFAAGDGVVLAKAAMLPPGYRVVKGGLVKTDRGHVGLLGDMEGVGRCLSAIIEGRRKGVGLGLD